MEVQINYWGVLLAALTSFAVGGIWYSRGVFGTVWGKLAKVKMDRPVSGGEMTGLMLTQAVLSFVTAYILAHVIFLAHSFYKDGWMMDALSTAFWIWLGFVMTRFLTHDMFEGRSKKLTLLNTMHELVTLLVMAAVIGWLHP